MRFQVHMHVILVVSLVNCVLAEPDTLTDSSSTAEISGSLTDQHTANSTADSTVGRDNDSAGLMVTGETALTVNDSVDHHKLIKQESDKKEKLLFDTIDASLLTSKLRRFQTVLGNNISKARVQGYGGGIIIQPMILGLRTKPVYELVRHDSQLKKFIFKDLINHDYQPLLVNGTWLYGGLGHGVRVGFGGWGGECFFGSNVTSTDSLMTLRVHTGFGGLMLEKVFLHNKINLITGGMIGAGSIKVTKSYQDADVFGFAAWNEDINNGSEAKARQIGLELHTGMTISLLSWWHLGLDLNGYFLLSVNGFGGSVNSFATVNPGIRLRVVLGNLG